MATSWWISDQEEIIAKTREVVVEIGKVYKRELNKNDGECYPENIVCWAALAEECKKLQKELAKSIPLLEGEHGDPLYR